MPWSAWVLLAHLLLSVIVAPTLVGTTRTYTPRYAALNVATCMAFAVLVIHAAGGFG